jgi:hypothetical protein
MELSGDDPRLRAIYARWLDISTKAGFAIALAAFALYAGGASPALVPLAELPRYWALPVDRFIAATGAPHGWQWLRLLHYGDALNLAAVALLGLITPACYARLLPALVAERDWLRAALAAAQLAVLAAAASGLLAPAG